MHSKLSKLLRSLPVPLHLGDLLTTDVKQGQGLGPIHPESHVG